MAPTTGILAGLRERPDYDALVDQWAADHDAADHAADHVDDTN